MSMSSIDIPEFSNILSIQVQDGKVQLWASCPDNKLVKRYFNHYFTGELLRSNKGVYLATVQWGNLVTHIFEIPAPIGVQG